MVPNSIEQRLINTIVAKQTSSDLVDDAGQPGRLLFEGHGVVHVLVAKVLDRGREVAEEDCAKIRRDEGQKIAGYAQTLLSPTSSAISMLAPSTVSINIRIIPRMHTKQLTDSTKQKTTIQAEFHVGRPRSLGASSGDVLA